MSTTDFERLERLEQAITLCLQEIDHNFIRCHRVATACLPVVERYAEQSRAVWDGAKFWKGFFEAAAEVSVSGYEELAEPTDAGDMTGSSLFTADAGTPDVHRRTKSNEENAHGPEHLSMDALSLADMSTPKGRHYKNPSKQIQTPYEKIQHQIQQQYRIESSDASISHPTVFDRYSAAENTQESPQAMESPLSVKSLHHPASSPSSTPRVPPPSTIKRRSPGKKQGPLLHRVLDNNWRLQATPLSKRSLYADIDALSSPPAPEITSQIFSPSPMAKMLKTPLTQRRHGNFDDSDDDSERDFGMSPPVTMQFTMPASKLVKTPARTAAMNIVEEVLRTAGAKDTSLESIRTPRPSTIGGRKLSANASDKEMWNAIRAAGSGGTDSSSKRRVDVDLDGSPFVNKTTETDDRTMSRVPHVEHTSNSLGDWQESEDWLH